MASSVGHAPFHVRNLHTASLMIGAGSDPSGPLDIGQVGLALQVGLRVVSPPPVRKPECRYGPFDRFCRRIWPSARELDRIEATFQGGLSPHHAVRFGTRAAALAVQEYIAGDEELMHRAAQLALTGLQHGATPLFKGNERDGDL